MTTKQLVRRIWLVGVIVSTTSMSVAGPIDHLASIDLTAHLRGGGVPRDGIPAMTNPDFVPAAEAFFLADLDAVIGVYIDGVAKAYPEALGWRHEIINDQIGDRFISVTLCPLTGTPQVFDATDEDGFQIEFGVSGLLINSNLVMYDRRDEVTLYPQMIYTAINGENEGDRLTLLPVVHTTFGRWKQLHPDTQVAEFGSGLDRYSSRLQDAFKNLSIYEYPYGNYRTNNSYLIFPWKTSEPDLSRHNTKDLVLGVCMGDLLRAYPFSEMGRQAVINDEIDGNSILVVYERGTSIPYSRDVNGQTLTFFEVEGAGDLPVWIEDVETRSLWSMAGVAVDGPLQGERLEQIPSYNSMWFAWHTYWPQTTLWNGEGIIDEPPPITAILEPVTDAMPGDFVLDQNYPNPFNPSTRIRFDLPHDGEIHLAIYNTMGQRIRRLADGFHRAGVYELTWDGGDGSGRAVASGAYIYRLESAELGLVASRQLVLSR